MKRSTINQLIAEAKELFNKVGFQLPPFAFWSPDDWAGIGPEANEIRDCALGWDVTDFGLGDFEACGLVLFTIRNGNYLNQKTYQKRYAEKIMIVKEEQVAPWHFHKMKREDIINRGGGNLVMELYRASQNEKLSDTPFAVSIDGVRKACLPGELVVLKPGESICLEPYLYHKFYGEKGSGTVIAGEVSDVTDDENDNFFLAPIDRFTTIEEDEKPSHFLCNEYPAH